MCARVQLCICLYNFFRVSETTTSVGYLPEPCFLRTRLAFN